MNLRPGHSGFGRRHKLSTGFLEMTSCITSPTGPGPTNRGRLHNLDLDSDLELKMLVKNVHRIISTTYGPVKHL